MIIRFQFDDPYPSMIQVEEYLTDAQLDEIKSAIDSYVSEMEDLEVNDVLVTNVMSRFPYHWKFIEDDYTFYV